MAVYKNLGIILKSVTTTISTDQNKKTSTTVRTMAVESVMEKDVSENLFKIPAGYKKTETMSQSENSSAGSQSSETQNTNKNNNMKPEDLLKKLM